MAKNCRVKIQSKDVVMATAMGDIFGLSTADQMVDTTFHPDPGSSRGDDGLNRNVEPIGDDPVETYFACITICTEQLRQSH